MTITEIREFFADSGEEREKRITLPACAKSAFEGELHGSVRLYTKIDADSQLLSGGHIFVRISDLRHPAAISLNGLAMGMPTAEEPVYIYDITDRLALGENTLEISFEEEGGELSSAGVFGGVELLRFASKMIDTLTVECARVGEDAEVSIRLTTLGEGESVRAVATLTSASGQIYYAGLTRGRGKITVKDPLFWWPRGMGSQNLYKLTVNLWGEYEIEDTREIKIGFSELSFAAGKPEANGEPFIPLGAVYRPTAASSPREERDALTHLMKSLASSGANTLIVPNGTPRVPDLVYDLADSYGIVVIHEAESADSLTRARLAYQGYRPSVGMIDLLGSGDDIEKITEALREVCSAAEVNYRENKGEYLKIYTLPSEKTLCERVPLGERNPFSAYLSPIREEMLNIIRLASENYPYAPNLSSLAYLSRLSSAQTAEGALLKERLCGERAIYDTACHPTGLLSSGINDSCGRHLSLYYCLARGFSGNVLYAVGDKGVIDFYVMRSTRRESAATVELRIATFDNEPIYLQRNEVTVNKTAVTKLFTRDFSEHIRGREGELYLEYTLRDETGVLSRRIYTFTEIRKLKLSKPKIKCEISGGDTHFGISLTADTFTVGAELSFDMDGVSLSENIVDLVKKTPYKIFVTTDRVTTKEALREALKIRCVNELLQA